jgi:uncharacterized protein (DUF433 family)
MNMMVATAHTLGIGLYSPEEAAFYARVQPRLLNRWLFAQEGENVVEPQIIPSNGEKTVTFLDLIQALAIRAIRNQYKIPLQKIREAVINARQKWGVEYPFAMKHTTCLFSDKQKAGHGEILIRLPGHDDLTDERLVQLSGKKSGNLVMHQIVEVYLDELSFDAEGLATEWRPLQWRQDSVLLNPHRRFGEPLIESCGHTAQTLWEASEAEGGIKNAARAYGVSEDAVRLACKYYDHLRSNAA